MLLEAMIALGAMASLVVFLLSLAVETSGFVAVTDSDLSVQEEAQRALSRLSSVLRKSGRAVVDETSFPAVEDEGQSLKFRLPLDTNGDGSTFDPLTGERTWSTKVYSVKTVQSALGIYDGSALLLELARGVTSIQFTTMAEDASLPLTVVNVEFTLRRSTGRGFNVEQKVSASIHLRN
jgi:hypothetical protein